MLGILEYCRSTRFGREGGKFRQGHVLIDGGSVEPSSQQLSEPGVRFGLSSSLLHDDQEQEPSFLKTTLTRQLCTQLTLLRFQAMLLGWRVT